MSPSAPCVPCPCVPAFSAVGRADPGPENAWALFHVEGSRGWLIQATAVARSPIPSATPASAANGWVEGQGGPRGTLLRFLVPPPALPPPPLSSKAEEGRSEAAGRPGEARGLGKEGARARARFGAGLQDSCGKKGWEGGARGRAGAEGEGARERGPPAGEARGGAARGSMGEAGEEFQSPERSWSLKDGGGGRSTRTAAAGR